MISDADWQSYDAMIGGTILTERQTKFEYTSRDGFHILVTGSGFSYDAMGRATLGVISSITVDVAGVPYAHYFQLAYALTDYMKYTFGTVSGSPDVRLPDIDKLFEGMRSGADLIRGNELGRLISGYNGNDTIFGGGGDDTLFGGFGQDWYNGGSGIDTVSFAGAKPVRGAVADLSLNHGTIFDDGYGFSERLKSIENLAGTVKGDRLTGNVSDNTLWGDAGADTLTGGGGHDALYGNSGNDRLDGQAGDDTIEGDTGRDTSYGGDGIDALVFQGVSSDGHGVTLIMTAKGRVVLDDGYGNAENATGFEVFVGSNFSVRIADDSGSHEIWGNAGNDKLQANAGNDRLFGDEGTDQLFGGGGFDVLWGGSGADTLSGGGDIDWFVFDSPAAAGTDVDRIKDFVSGEDVIWLPIAWGTDLVVGRAGPHVFANAPGAFSSTLQQRVIFDQVTGELYFDIDGLGGASPVKIAQLDGVGPAGLQSIDIGFYV